MVWWGPRSAARPSGTSPAPSPERPLSETPDARAAGILLHPTSLPGPLRHRRPRRLGRSLPRLGGGRGADALAGAAARADRRGQLAVHERVGVCGKPAADLSASGWWRTGSSSPRRWSTRRSSRATAWTSRRCGTGRSTSCASRGSSSGTSPSRAQRDALAEFRDAPEQAAWLEDWCRFAALKAYFRGRPGRSGGPTSPSATPTPSRRPTRRSARRWTTSATSSSSSSASGSACGARRASAASPSSATSRSTSRTTARTCGRTRSSSSSTPRGRPTAVAGVPPDYFSATGQLWGNPLYRWDVLKDEGYAWWIARIRSCLAACDLLRIDHFRAFSAYWSVPATEKTALGGRWVPGPGRGLFDAARAELGALPILAEDLGDIDDDVRELLAALGFPGMKILQFGFYGSDSQYLPHRYPKNSVVYTGTHDNDTARGWYAALKPEERERVWDYLGCDGREIEWFLIRAAYDSVAERAIVPLQDVLGLGSEARMNTPALPEGNWALARAGGRAAPGARRAPAADGGFVGAVDAGSSRSADGSALKRTPRSAASDLPESIGWTCGTRPRRRFHRHSGPPFGADRRASRRPAHALARAGAATVFRAAARCSDARRSHSHAALGTGRGAADPRPTRRSRRRTAKPARRPMDCSASRTDSTSKRSSRSTTSCAAASTTWPTRTA